MTARSRVFAGAIASVSTFMSGTCQAQVASADACAGRSDVLGVSRIVEIDTAAAPRFGAQFNEGAFLEDGEVVLTFDDGPLRHYTQRILDALEEQCTKATFFIVGRMAIADPEMLKETARRGHTIGIHTWSHKKLTAVSSADAEKEIELGLSATVKALGEPVAPFFRFPYLSNPKRGLQHLAERKIGVFGIDVDSRDFNTRNPAAVLRTTMAQLQTTKKGIILFHDIQPSTASAIKTLLSELKSKGFRVVHMIPKTAATTLPQYDALAEQEMSRKVAAASKNPLATRSVVWPSGTDKGGESGKASPAANAEELPWLKKPSGSPPAAAPSPPPATPPDRPSRKSTSDWLDPWQIRMGQ